MLLISSLIMLPVITESKYFSILISRQLQHNADEMVSVYVDNFVKETGETFDALRSAVFFLSTDQGARSIMSSGTSATQIDILSVEQAFYRAFSTNGSINADIVNAIYLVQNETNYFPIYGGHYGLNPAERILNVYRQYYKANSTRKLFTTAGQDDYAYFITDYVDIDTVNPLGKIIVELNVPNLLNIASLQSLYPSAAALFSDRSGAVIGAYGKEPPDHFDTTDEKTVTLEGKRWQHFYSDLQSDRERTGRYSLFDPRKHKNILCHRICNFDSCTVFLFHPHNDRSPSSPSDDADDSLPRGRRYFRPHEGNPLPGNRTGRICF